MVKPLILDFLVMEVKELVKHPKIMDLCYCPYGTNKNGCTNVNKDNFEPYMKDMKYMSPCVPNAKYIDEIAYGPWTLVCAVVDFEDYLIKMKELHENWSTKQLRNVYYWQGSVRSRLTKRTIKEIPGLGNIYFDRPEAHGVNVFQTMKKLGVKMDKNPEKLLYKINLIGTMLKPGRKRFNF